MKVNEVRLKLTDESLTKLDLLARRMGTSRTTIVRFALNRYFALKGLNTYETNKKTI